MPTPANAGNCQVKITMSSVDTETILYGNRKLFASIVERVSLGFLPVTVLTRCCWNPNQHLYNLRRLMYKQQSRCFLRCQDSILCACSDHNVILVALILDMLTCCCCSGTTWSRVAVLTTSATRNPMNYSDKRAVNTTGFSVVTVLLTDAVQ